MVQVPMDLEVQEARDKDSELQAEVCNRGRDDHDGKDADEETALQLNSVFFRWNYSRWFLSNGLDKSLEVERSAHFFTIGYEEISNFDNWESMAIQVLPKAVQFQATLQKKPEDTRKFNSCEMAITFYLQ